MYKLTNEAGQSIFFTSERDAERERKAGDTLTTVPRIRRGSLHNENN